VKALFDLRPALAGYAGIPQETRLLFSALQGLDGVQVDGLIQSGTGWLPPGPGAHGGETEDQRRRAADRIAHALSTGDGGRFVRLARLGLAATVAAFRCATGRAEKPVLFETAGLEDVVWRRLFEKTLAAERRAQLRGVQYFLQRTPRAAAHAVGMLTGLMGRRSFPMLDTEGYDIMIAETPYAGRVRPGTQLIVRYHDAIPMTMPETVRRPSYDRTMHLHALRQNVADGAWLCCVSEATRKELLRSFPLVASRCVVIPNFISPQYRLETSPPEAVAAVLAKYANDRVRTAAASQVGRLQPAGQQSRSAPRYVLMVSTIEPRKNHIRLVRAWSQLRKSGHVDLELVLVGSLGWRHEEVLGELLPWIARGDAHLLEGVPSEELRTLYRHAAVVVCPSASEGFGYSGVEALLCGGRVVASDLPVHREVYGEAAGYFEPNSDTALAAALQAALVHPESGDQESVMRSRSAATAPYEHPRLLAAWSTLLRRIQSDAPRQRIAAE
jgi:glycosyltransferase involved in cell wall biosynthesis